MNPLDYLKENEQKSLDQLKEFLRIPSVSAQSKHKKDMEACAKWIVDYLNEIGVKAQTRETGGHPLVFGHYHQSDDLTTVLIYGHYDVQPEDPLDLWESTPFEPTEKDGYLYARGASDDKGQMLTHIKGVEAYLKTEGKLPVNVKFLIEGEEEAGATHIDEFIENNKELLAADVVLISDGSQYGMDMPAINIGLRGISLVSIKVTGPDKDLHSGSFGGSVANPIHVLCKMISRLHDEDGRIQIEGFYNKVYKAPDKEREQYAKLPFDEAGYIASTGVPKLWGEKGFTPQEQTWIRPTVEINGITGGYQGEGSKTIVPSWASAKITMRLVPDMDPDEICDLTEAYLKKICPDTVKLEVNKFGGAYPVQVPIDSPWLKAASSAIKIGFGNEPVFCKEGGSIPVVATFKLALGLDTLLVGFGHNTDQVHSPNERFYIKDFHRGCRTSVALLDELSKVK